MFQKFNQKLRHIAGDVYESVVDHGRGVAVASGTALSSFGASAQTVDPFTTAMTEITGKVETYAGALVVLSAVAVVFMVAMKYVKKIPRAS